MIIFFMVLQSPSYGFVQALGDISHIVRVKTGHGNSTIPCHVDMRLLYHSFRLLRVQTGEAGEEVRKTVFNARWDLEALPEHADLVDNVIPITRCLEFICEELV